MTKIRFGIPIAIALLAAGCSAHYYWTKQGATFSQFSRDDEACTGEMAMPTKTGAYRVVSKDLYGACMTERGWRRAKEMSPPPAGWYRGIEDDAVIRPAPSASPDLDARWLVGRWTDGSNTELSIGADLVWELVFTDGERSKGLGDGRIEGRNRVMMGCRYTSFGGSGQRSMSITLRREADQLVGEIRTWRAWPVALTRMD
jgi:hypothetical protein